MERFSPEMHRCPFGLLCASSATALLIFLLALFLVA